jgi:hypothetical protein
MNNKSEKEIEILFKEHLKECINISNKLKKHKFYKEREMVIKWMFDICKEEEIIEDIFIQSSNLFDKILIKFKETNIMKIEYLQLIACACLLIVSKLMLDNNNRGKNENDVKLTIKKLIFYTDNTYTIEELCDMEMLLIINIDWNINDYYNIYNDLISLIKPNQHNNNGDGEDRNKLNKIILNIFIFNNIFMLNYSIYFDHKITNKNTSISLLFYLISIKLFYNKKNKSKKLINLNKYFISNVEDLILNNSILFSFINNFQQQEQQVDEGFIEDTDSSSSSSSF